MSKLRARVDDVLDQGWNRLWLLWAVDITVALAGGWILWMNAAGQTVADPTLLGTAVFVLVTGALLNVRRAVAGASEIRFRSGNAGLTRPEVFEYIRDLALVLFAAASSSMTSYLAQWLIAYAGLVLAVSGIGRVLVQLVVGPTWSRMTMPLATVGSGALALILTNFVHNFNMSMLGFLAALLAVAWGGGLLFDYWYDIVLGTPRPSGPHQ